MAHGSDRVAQEGGEPWVVILAGSASRVTVVELPPMAGEGLQFDLGGRRWRVVGRRPRTRVLLAEPV